MRSNFTKYRLQQLKQDVREWEANVRRYARDLAWAERKLAKAIEVVKQFEPQVGPALPTLKELDTTGSSRVRLARALAFIKSVGASYFNDKRPNGARSLKVYRGYHCTHSEMVKLDRILQALCDEVSTRAPKSGPGRGVFNSYKHRFIFRLKEKTK